MLSDSCHGAAKIRLIGANANYRPCETRGDAKRAHTMTPFDVATEESSSTTICVTGMHRSGTSMIARLLHDCGVDFGPEDELQQPVPDNTEGYFENRQFVKLNEDILAHFGGSWLDPPRLPTGWEFSPQIDSLLERAEALIRQFRRRAWGWKDPRNSLTLPLWQRLLPQLKIIVCVRNPLGVARSLFVRGDTRDASQFHLWLTYYRQLLAAMRPEQRLVTHYRSYFHNPREELNRVVRWLDLKVSDETMERACAHVSTKLRHHFVEAAELVASNAPDEVLGLYFSLCAEAGQIYQQARGERTSDELARTAARNNEVGALLNEIQQLRTASAARERTLDEILNSKSFRLVSLYWRLRRKK